MQVLYFFETIRNPLCDALVSLITTLGEETAFMAIAIIFFWCVSKAQGYFLLITGFIGTVINQFLKIIFRVPRPWVLDPEFTIVESAKEGASGYSFPSGHTQTSVTLYGGIARSNGNKILRSICIAICVLVPFSRLYLGVHTPLDVGVSVIISLLVIFLGYPVMKIIKEKPNAMYIIIGGFALLITAFTLYVMLYPFPSEVYLPENVSNLESARKNAFTMIGCVCGLAVVYFVDSNYIKFETKAVWWAQVLKVVIGLALVIAVKELLRTPLDYIFNGSLVSRAVRYFLMVVTAGVVWPLSFKWFSKLGKK